MPPASSSLIMLILVIKQQKDLTDFSRKSGLNPNSITLGLFLAYISSFLSNLLYLNQISKDRNIQNSGFYMKARFLFFCISKYS